MIFSVFTFRLFKKRSSEQSQPILTAPPRPQHLSQLRGSTSPHHTAIYLRALNDLPPSGKLHYIPAVRALKFMFQNG